MCLRMLGNITIDIKLRIMSGLTEKGDDKAASLYWKDTMYKEHEKNMIEMLYSACYSDEE